MEGALEEIVYSPALAAYRFAPSHPLRPERFVLAVDLADAWGLLGRGEGQASVVAPGPASDKDLLRVHSAAYLATVRRERSPEVADAFHGLGQGDTPRFPRMHEAAALVCGATMSALDDVVGGRTPRAFSPAGGMHHAHRERAAGFCIYNDCAVAIARATARHPGVRVAYVDIDAHHGDGVEEAFSARSDVLTLSVHESGRYLYPGTGAARDVGTGAGVGATINVPLPPYAGPREYRLVFERVVEPALDAFAPDVIVAQLGADTHKDDPLTHLAMTVEGHAEMVTRLVECADRLCGGRIVATGGGGYDAFSATPRMWAAAMAVLLGVEVPDLLPGAWIERATTAAAQAGASGPQDGRTFFESPSAESPVAPSETRRLTIVSIDEVRAVSPLLGGTPTLARSTPS